MNNCEDYLPRLRARQGKKETIEAIIGGSMIVVAVITLIIYYNIL